MDIGAIINKMYDFLESNYPIELEQAKLQSQKVFYLDHAKLQAEDPELAEFVLLRWNDFARAMQVLGSTLQNDAQSAWNAPGVIMVDRMTSQPFNQVNHINQVNQPIRFPSYISTNEHKVLWLLSLVKSASAREIWETLKIDRKTLSVVFSRPARGTGLVNQGLVDNVVDSEVVDNIKRWKITEKGKEALTRLGENLQMTLLPEEGSEHEIKFRFFNLPVSTRTDIGSLRNRNLDKLITIEAVVRRKGDVRPRATVVKYECPTCGNVISVIQADPRHFKEPSACSCGRKGRFKQISKQLKDVQYLTIEDWGNNIDAQSGVQRLQVLFEDDLCDRQNEAHIGNRVLFFGVLRDMQKEHHGVKTSEFDIYLEVNNFKNLDDKTIKLTSEEEAEIKEYAAAQGHNVLNDLSGKFAPNIAGNDHIKKACLLQLASRDISGFKTRLRIHLHFFGHPGIAKTDLGLFSFRVSHKSVYVDVSKSTGVGLTAAAVQDDRTKTWQLEAGALPLAGEGLVFLDELDKAEEEQLKGLGEPMEKGTITVAKGSLGSQTLPGIARILSAGNMSDKYKDTGFVDHTALKIQHHLVDRFDLVLQGEKIERQMLLTKMLMQDQEESEEELDFLRKYLFYAFYHEVSPDVSPNVFGIFQTFFQELETASKAFEFRISPRLINTLRRLALASAKLRLADKIDDFDAKVATALIRRSFADRGVTWYEQSNLQQD